MGGQTSNETGNTSWARTMPTKVKSEDCIFVQVKSHTLKYTYALM